MNSNLSKTWRPKWTAKEKEALEDLRRRNEVREDALKKIFAHGARPQKWNWPESALNIVKDAQEDAGKGTRELLTRDLKKLYTWPSEELAKDDVFIEGKGAFSMFDRKSTWLEDQGFYKFQTNYTFSDNWDKQFLTATILVPKGLRVEYKAPVMWLFHGGGYCTGAGDFPAWYSQTAVRRAKARGAIIIAPDYPLGPEGNYKDIVDSLTEFLHWYKEDGCFEPDFTRWTEWLYSQTPAQSFTVDKKSVYVEGESAGGLAAVTALWINATKGGPNLPIDVALLRYPMIAHYERSWDKSANLQGKVAYMGEHFTQDQVDDRAMGIYNVLKELEALGLVPTCSSRWPPVGMAFAFILSMHRSWQRRLQREHGCVISAEGSDADYKDGIGRAKGTYRDIVRDLLSPMYIFHGNDDLNCPVNNTKYFVKVLRDPDYYGYCYEDNSTLYLDVVKRLNKAPYWDPETKVLSRKETDVVGHAFDYSLDEDDEPFLKKAYDWVGSRWGAH